MRAQSPLGPALLLALDGEGRLASVTTPGGRVIRYEYDGSQLARVIYPDGGVRCYVYEAGDPTLLTGIEGGVSSSDATIAVGFRLRGSADRSRPSVRHRPAPPRREAAADPP